MLCVLSLNGNRIIMQKSILDDIETHNGSISRLLGKELTKNSFWMQGINHLTHIFTFGDTCTWDQVWHELIFKSTRWRLNLLSMHFDISKLFYSLILLIPFKQVWHGANFKSIQWCFWYQQTIILIYWPFEVLKKIHVWKIWQWCF